MCDLRWLQRWTVNRLGPNPHLYLVNAICRHTKKKIFALLKAAEAVHIDEIVESLELVFRPLRCSWLLSSLS